jgi:hypothetical protein
MTQGKFVWEVCLCVFLLNLLISCGLERSTFLKGEWKFDVYKIICMVVIITEVPEAAMHVDLEKLGR